MRLTHLTQGVAAVLLVAVLAGCGSTYRSSGIIYFRQKNWEKAVEQLSLAVKQNPKDVEAQINLAVSLAELKRYGEAATHFQAAREATVDPRKLNEAKLQQEHYRVQLYNKAVELTKMEPPDVTGAIANLQSAIEVWPQEPQAYRLLGYLYGKLPAAGDEEKKANLDKAVATLRQAAEMEPAHAGTWMDLGATLRRAARGEEAVAAFEEALKHNPSDDQKAECFSRLGDLAFNQRDYAAARGHYTKAIEVDPSDPQIYYMAGLASYNEQKYADAANFFGKAADYSQGKDDEVYLDSIYKMGVAAVSGEDFARAVEAANQYLAKRESADAYRLRGSAKTKLANQLESQNRRAEAEKSRTEGLEDLKKANELSGGGG